MAAATKGKARRRRASAKAKSSRAGTRVELRLFTQERGVFRRLVRDGLTDNQMYPSNKKWDYIVQNRMRLTGEVAESSHEELERMFLEDFPNERNLIEDLSQAEIIEVAMPFEAEDTGWAARLFPWEDVLTLVTRRMRPHPLTVIRHLMCDRAVEPRVLDEGTLLRVQNTPDQLKEQYNFDSESKLVDLALRLRKNEPLRDPTAKQLRTRIVRSKPDIIHLAVLDTHVLADLLHDAGPRETEDGIILAPSEGSPDGAVYYQQLAELLTAARANKPALVSFATCFSGRRMAPLAVGKGATAAIGFLDTLYDAVSEEFFSRFYSELSDSGWNLLAAFQKAVRVMADQDPRYRSTAMLWTASTALSPGLPFATRPDKKSTRRGTAAARAARKIVPEEALVVHCKPEIEMNYCALHNGRELFKKFEIKKTDVGKLPPVDIQVELSAENEAAIWRHSIEFGDAPESKNLLEGGVHVPLGLRSLRRVQESTRSSLYVKIACGDAVLYQATSDITLLPVDQWTDSEEDRRWLPSFVLPRDPAVRTIMAGADRYLRALTDDSHAGFDGYQQIAANPEIVDLQVRAIWCSVLYDRQLRYVNPPPTYSGWSQRLRTPSQVLAEGRGTCIDLSVILASCLEYVGIYPVIILIAGHAFPGWWRSDGAHQQFAGFGYFESEVSPENATDRSLAPTPQDYTAEWMVKRDGFREVVAPLREGSLAVIESTLLCTGGGFHEAMEEGQTNMMDASIFDALVDVQRARQAKNPVTPLPIVSSTVDSSVQDRPTS